MPFDPYANPWDPLARVRDPYAFVGLPRRQEGVQPLTPQEEDSALGKIGGNVLGGIGYVGSVLEKTFGGRAVRGLLGGKPREALSVLPFSDTLGITDYNDRVSGQELLGLKGRDDWGSTLAGLGVELATDPSLYLSFGGSAVGEAGTLASKLGMLPKTASGRVGGTLRSLLAANPGAQTAAETVAGGAAKLGGLLDEPLGGLVGLGLPFSKPSFLFGQGQAGLDAISGAGKLASGADSLLRQVPLLGSQYGHAADLAGKGLDFVQRYGRAAFDPSVMGATTHLGQEAAGEAHAAILPYLAARRTKLAEYGQQLAEAGVDPTGEALRAVVEGRFRGPAHPLLLDVAQSLRGDLDETLKHLQGLGINASQLDDVIDYLPRYHTPLAKPTLGHSTPQQPLLPADARVTGRLDLLKNFEDGTAGINAMLADPALYQGTPLQRAQAARQYLDAATRGTRGQPGYRAALRQGRNLANWAAGLDPQYAAAAQAGEGLNFFGNHPLADLAHYYERVSRLKGAGEATQNLFARTAQDALAGGAAQGAKSLPDALRAVSLTGADAEQAALGALIKQGRGPISPDALADLYVPGEVLGEATRYLRPFTQPEYVSTPLSLFDRATSWTKALQTAPWPAFHVRNFTSGQVQNLAAGIADSPGGALRQVADAHALQGGGVLADAAQIPHLPAGLSPEQATKALAREMYAWGVGGHTPHLAREGVGPLGTPVNLGTDLEGFLARVPGEQPKTLAGAAGALAQGGLDAWTPWNVAGVRTNADLFAPVAAGRQLGDVVEGTNRGALYLGLRRQGFTPEAAAKRVLDAHFDYTPGAKTSLERNVLSRLVPFYSYQKGVVPYVTNQLLERPGGLYGTVARTAQDLRQQSGFLPEYLGGGLATPLGEEKDGTRRYLTRVDTPVESAFEWLKSSPEQTLMGLLGQTNPLIKGPLEYATGKQFFTGRDVGDLYSMTGSSTLDQLVANSPFSRLATTARTLADERKWQDPLALTAIPLNLLTGAKVSDVDVARQREQAAREYVTQTLGRLPEFGKFETLYLKPGMEALLTPQEMEFYRLQKTLQTRAQQRAKEKK